MTTYDGIKASSSTYRVATKTIFKHLKVWQKKGKMKFSRCLSLTIAISILAACGTLEKKSILINYGDSKDTVLSIMGLPGDRQFKGKEEAWQYGQTGAGFGYHDYRIIWFYDGKVTGIESYKDYTPASSASAHFKQIRWENAPDYTLEIRDR